MLRGNIQTRADVQLRSSPTARSYAGEQPPPTVACCAPLQDDPQSHERRPCRHRTASTPRVCRQLACAKKGPARPSVWLLRRPPTPPPVSSLRSRESRSEFSSTSSQLAPYGDRPRRPPSAAGRHEMRGRSACDVVEQSSRFCGTSQLFGAARESRTKAQLFAHLQWLIA